MKIKSLPISQELEQKVGLLVEERVKLGLPSRPAWRRTKDGQLSLRWRGELKSKEHLLNNIREAQKIAMGFLWKREPNGFLADRNPQLFRSRLVSKIIQSDDCWEWIGARSKQGYGDIFLRGKHRKAHRVFYETFVSSIPDGKILCHKCDNPICVNPNHMFIGTCLDNVMDCISKGRKKTKLSEADVVEIRENKSGLTRKQLSEQYGVTDREIYRIMKQITWKNIENNKSWARANGYLGRK